VLNGTIAADATQAKQIWYLRESVAGRASPIARALITAPSEGLKKAGYTYKYDLSLPLDHFYRLVEVMKERIGSKATVCGYGHVGDCNLHLNISTPKWNQEVFDLIEPFVFDYTSKHRGSVSAEHGIGSHKTQFLGHSKSAAAIATMRAIKAAIDPNAIMNPYKVLPQ
jgi:D-2-hydroxyglutarate dehydrogenase